MHPAAFKPGGYTPARLQFSRLGRLRNGSAGQSPALDNSVSRLARKSLKALL